MYSRKFCYADDATFLNEVKRSEQIAINFADLESKR